MQLKPEQLDARLRNSLAPVYLISGDEPLRVLEAAEKGSRWEKGVPVSRGDTRSDLSGDGVREACTLGARFAADGSKDGKLEAAE